MANQLNISMLGSFTIERDGVRIDDSNNRMRKVWLLLAYLIYTRRSRATQDHYLSLIQSAGSESEDPSGRLKALFYRTRTMLDTLGNNAGHELIIRKDGTYAWNPDVPLTLDAEEFDRLYDAAFTAEEDDRLTYLLQALSLYQGDFLNKLSMEAWVMPITAYYHQRFQTAAEQALTLLEARQRWTDARTLCEKALKIEPYSEEFYQHLMRCQIAQGDRGGAVNSYETMSQLLFDTFGVMPSEDSRKLYREASRELGSGAVPSEAIRDQLQEPSVAKGAMFCEYDFFKLLYQVQARALIRSGDVVHIALLSLHGEDRKALPRRSLDRAMENLTALVIGNLRQGDVVTKCSSSQLIVMLPQANYENSCAVCQRICKAFARQYPHSPAQIHFSVHPLEPSMPDHHGK